MSLSLCIFNLFGQQQIKLLKVAVGFYLRTVVEIKGIPLRFHYTQVQFCLHWLSHEADNKAAQVSWNLHSLHHYSVSSFFSITATLPTFEAASLSPSFTSLQSSKQKSDLKLKLSSTLVSAWSDVRLKDNENWNIQLKVLEDKMKRLNLPQRQPALLPGSELRPWLYCRC